MNQVYLNGEFVPADQARVSVFDRGFVFADGVYEVIPVYGGRLFRFPQHLERLAASLAGIRIANPLAPAAWRQVCERLIAGNGATDQYIYLQVTRGAAPRDHAFPVNVPATVFVFAKPIEYPDPATRAAGVAAITLPDVRWGRCDIKSIALLANVLARQQAVEQGCAEAILIRDGYVTEGAASNIFIVRDGCVLTPPTGRFLLPGITRDLVLELAARHGVPARESAFSEGDLRGADEVWLTSSTKEILPITRIDDAPVGAGVAGPVYRRMFDLYQRYKDNFRAGRAD